MAWNNVILVGRHSFISWSNQSFSAKNNEQIISRATTISYRLSRKNCLKQQQLGLKLVVKIEMECDIWMREAAIVRFNARALQQWRFAKTTIPSCNDVSLLNTQLARFRLVSVWPEKNYEMPKNDVTRKMINFDTFTKIA